MSRATIRSALARVLFLACVLGILVGATGAVGPSVASAAVPQGRIAYTAVDSGEWVVRVVNPDGTDKRTVYRCPINSCELKLSPEAWDPTGQRLVVEQWTRVPCPGGNPPHPGDPPPPPRDDLYGCIDNPVVWQVINVDSGAVQEVAPAGLDDLWGLAHDGIPFWSPDGKWIAFTGVHHTDPAHPSTGNVIFDPYVVDSSGGNQKLMQVGNLETGFVSGWTPNNQVIVGNGLGLNRFNPTTGANAGLLSLTPGLAASVAPNGGLIGFSNLLFENTSNFDHFQLDSVAGPVQGISWSPDSGEVAYAIGSWLICCTETFPGPEPVLARAPVPGSVVRTVVPGEFVFGYVSWSPPTDPKVTIDTPVEGQEITGNESTQAEKDAVRLKGSVSSGSTPAGWCFSVQQPSASDPTTPPKTSCTRSFVSSSTSAGRTTSKFDANLASLVGTDLKPGENTVWVWGYGASADAGVAKVKVKVGPNYYIKHIEVAQALSPIEKFPDLGDPLASGPYTPTWEIQKVGDFPIPLIAGRSTLLRIYLGDSNLAAGKDSAVTIHYKVTVAGKIWEGDAVVRVTAEDLQPDQQKPTDAINVRIPAEDALGGTILSAEVAVNASEKIEECQDCYPAGNEATLGGIAFEPGGGMTLVPVPTVLIDNRTGRGAILPPEPAYAGVWPAVGDYLPVREGGVVLAPSPGTLVASVAELKRLSKSDQLAACSFLLDQVKVLHAVSIAPAAERWVGFSSHPYSGVGCDGLTTLNGTNIVLTRPDAVTLAHEIGHSLGLRHTLSLAGEPADGFPLPYVGIGAAGYSTTDPLDVYAATGTSDLMGDGPTELWTSPATWWRMHQAIVGLPGPAKRSRMQGPAIHSARAAAPRRLVSGYLGGNHAAIFSSIVANAAVPDEGGTVAGQLIAVDRRSRVIAKTRIAGTALDAGGTSDVHPFVVALPDKKTIASLDVMSADGDKTLARLRRSKHSPRGRLLKLPKRASAKKPLRVRWRATDRDRGSKLSVLLQARRGKGVRRTVVLGPAAGSAALDPRALGKGKKLSVRLVVSDGLNTTVVDARPIKLAGR